MEEARKQTGADLRNFVKSLLNHRANAVTTSLTDVESKWRVWNASYEQHEQLLKNLESDYSEKHEVPRLASHQRYNEFIQQKQQLYYQYLQSKNQGDLYNWLRLTFNSEDDDIAAMRDQIYTMYSNPRYM